MAARKVLIRKSPFSQWFYPGVKPNIHFIPVERNLGDLIEKLEKLKANDCFAKDIATNALEFAENHL